MARDANHLGAADGQQVVFSRPLSEAIPTSQWAEILTDDTPIDIDVSIAELVRSIRDTGEA